MGLRGVALGALRFAQDVSGGGVLAIRDDRAVEDTDNSVARVPYFLFMGNQYHRESLVDDLPELFHHDIGVLLIELTGGLVAEDQ